MYGRQIVPDEFHAASGTTCKVPSVNQGESDAAVWCSPGWCGLGSDHDLTQAVMPGYILVMSIHYTCETDTTLFTLMLDRKIDV